MRIRFDVFGKNVLRDTLERVGTADTGVEVIAASQTMDVWYVPDPARATLKEGLQEGLKEGQIRVLVELFAEKLGRPLTEPERSVLAERFDALGLNRLDKIRLELSADALAAWLADPAAR